MHLAATDWREILQVQVLSVQHQAVPSKCQIKLVRTIELNFVLDGDEREREREGGRREETGLNIGQET